MTRRALTGVAVLAVLCVGGSAFGGVTEVTFYRWDFVFPYGYRYVVDRQFDEADIDYVGSESCGTLCTAYNYEIAIGQCDEWSPDDISNAAIEGVYHGGTYSVYDAFYTVDGETLYEVESLTRTGTLGNYDYTAWQDGLSYGFYGAPSDDIVLVWQFNTFTVVRVYLTRFVC